MRIEDRGLLADCNCRVSRLAPVFETLDHWGDGALVERLLNIVKAMALVFVIPLVALGISYAVSAKYDSDFQEAWQQYAQQNNQEVELGDAGDYRTICSDNRPEIAELCEPANELQTFELGAKASIAVGLVLLAMLLLGRVYGGSNRSRLAFVLSPLTRLMLLGLSISIVIQGALFVYGIYITEAVFVHRVHFVALAGAGLVALLGGFNLISIALRIMKDATLSQSGILIDSEKGSGLIQLVHDVADTVGARRPDNIVVGLEPSFFVTGAKVALNGDADPLDGTTLYMPLPFLRILDVDELRSVIGHEMGHFKGKDTEYSLKFYPAYSRLGSAITSLAGGSDGNSFVNVPTLAFLVLLHDEFSVVERKIGREREIFADQEGARAGSAMGLSRALLKFSEYAQLWGPIRNLNVESLNEGNIYSDLINVYFNVAQNTYSEIDFAVKRDDLLAFEMAHPNDTHPTLSERLIALGIDADTLTKEDLAPSDNAVTELLSGYDTIADELTIAEHRLMIGLGYASLPQESEQ